MRYFIREATLFLRGDFVGASTAVHGGIGRVSTIFNHSVPEDWDGSDPRAYIQRLARREGFGEDAFGLLTAVALSNLCILQYDMLTVFVTAGVRESAPALPGTINLIIYSREGLSPSALLETIIVATEAKTRGLQAAGYSCTGTPTDAVVVASEGEEKHVYAGVLTEVGRRVYAAVQFGVEQALKRHAGTIRRDAPSFFVYSRYGGDHWVEWRAEGCPYYPCHFPGQVCDFCYCPFYPCGDPALGELVESSTSGEIWSCSRCHLLPLPAVAEYLKRNPEATLRELKRYRDRLEKKIS